MKLKRLEDIRQLEFELEQARKHWLESRGWKSVHNTPGAYVLWHKTIEGPEPGETKAWTLSLEWAIKIQDAHDVHARWQGKEPTRRAEDVGDERLDGREGVNE